MQRYVEQLIDDINSRIAEAPAVTDYSVILDETELEEILETETSSDVRKTTIADVVGIEKMFLPPVDKLGTNDFDPLGDAVSRLWKAFHLHPMFPDNVPLSLRYRCLREHWEDEIIADFNGEICIDICNYDCADCPLEAYCSVCNGMEVDNGLGGEEWK